MNPSPQQLQPIHLGMGWEALLGATLQEMPAAIRKQRWEAWLMKCGNEGRAHWSNVGACMTEKGPCKHLDGLWCAKIGMPCNVNSMTLKDGRQGLACNGAGLETIDPNRNQHTLSL